MGHYMTNETAPQTHRAVIGLDNIDARREINRIADAVVHQTMSTDVMMSECTKIADMHYVTVSEVYKKVFEKANASPDLHPTHPAGKSNTYHELRRLATRK